MDGMIRVALYARVSSERQADELTIQSQVAALRQRIVTDGCQIEPELCFLDEGFSGSTMRRPALERLRDLAYSGVIDRLYVHSPDRLARKYAYQVVLMEEFKKQDVEVIYLNDIAGLNSPEGNLLMQMQGMIAEYERAKIMERTRRGRRFAARQGKVSVLGSAPYGYRYVSKHEAGGEARYEVLAEDSQRVQAHVHVGRRRGAVAGGRVAPSARARRADSEGAGVLGSRDHPRHCFSTRRTWEPRNMEKPGFCREKTSVAPCVGVARRRVPTRSRCHGAGRAGGDRRASAGQRRVVSSGGRAARRKPSPLSRSEKGSRVLAERLAGLRSL